MNLQTNEVRKDRSFSLRGFGASPTLSFNATDLVYFGSWQVANNSQVSLAFIMGLHSYN